jgi:hypothetical protein
MINFNPILEDPEFVEELHERSIYKKERERMADKSKDSNKFQIPSNLENERTPKYDYMLRDGMTPATKNVVNVRYKKDVDENPEEIGKIETILKDIIDFGFADHVEEELLYFDDQGKLSKTEKVPFYDKEPSNDDMSYNDDYRY